MDKDELRLREIGYAKGLDEAHARGYDGEFAEILALQYMDGFLEEYSFWNRARRQSKKMSELLDRVEEKGRIEGIAKGRIEGIAEGIDITRLESIKNVMEGLKYTARQTMDLLKIPADDRPRYLAKLQEK